MDTPRVRSRSEDRRAQSGGQQPQFRCAEDGQESLRRRSAGGRSDHSATSRRPQNAARRHISPSAARSSVLRAASRILVTTSGELILLPVWERHPKLNLGQRPFTRYSHSDNLPLFSRIFPAFRTFRVQNGG